MNRRIVAAVSDMIFASKIRGTAEALNVTPDLLKVAREARAVRSYQKSATMPC